MTKPMLSSEKELLHLARLAKLGELAACFAHEVCQPLSIMDGHLRLIEAHLPEDSPLHAEIKAIDRNSRRIRDMAKRTLNFSRKRNTRMEECEIEDWIQDAVNFVQPYLRDAHSEVQVHVDLKGVRATVDRWQMVQVLVNLMHNAADAMANCKHRQLTVSALHDESHVRIEVADTGKGIPLSDIRNVFLPFFTTKGEGGTGLGLYIAHRIVEDHHGTLTLQTSEQGSTFTICIPLT